MAAAERVTKRPRRGVNRDTVFFTEGLKQGKILIQRCKACGVLRHPPRPTCAACNSFDWDAVQASGRGTIYSYTTIHHGLMQKMRYPPVAVLVAMEEGVRMVGDLADPDKSPPPAIGQMVRAEIAADPGDDMLLVRWRIQEK
jgi:uncharacterized OB-fold protein